MPAKNNPRNWNDVQTAIATTAIVTTLGLWNLFATPAKAEAVKSSELVSLPPTEEPREVEVRVVAPLIATPLPQVKIMFTPGSSLTTVQPVQNNQQAQTKKKKKKDNNSSGGGAVTTTTVTQTRTS
jgi:hypothetical protein